MLLFTLFLALSYATPLPQGSASPPSLTDLLSSTPDLVLLNTVLLLVPDIRNTLANSQGITLLAPNNAAFLGYLGLTPQGMGQVLPDLLRLNTTLLAAVLQYHVLSSTVMAADIPAPPGVFAPTLLTNPDYTSVSGGQVVHGRTVDNTVSFQSGNLAVSTVQKADLLFTGGVLHIVDSVLNIPPPISQATTTDGVLLSSLMSALQSTSLLDPFDTTPDITAFAPLNLAFAAASSTLNSLSTAQLADVLKYHIVSGTVGYSPDLQNGQQLQTLNGGDVSIGVQGGGTGVTVNNQRALVPNVLVRNGVVHVIDGVLMPRNGSTMITKC